LSFINKKETIRLIKKKLKMTATSVF